MAEKSQDKSTVEALTQVLDDSKPRKTAVLDTEDVVGMVPKLKGREKLVTKILHWLKVDKVNDVHARNCHTPGPQFVKAMLIDDFKIRLRIDNEQQLDNLPEGAFITISNHPFGALDGISLIHMVAQRRPEFKVMVNMILSRIWAMEPNFIAVDALQTDDPAKKAISLRGIKQAMSQVRDGKPMGFFPAGAVSKLNWKLQLRDREWQPTIIRLIKQMNVPVIPIYFHGRNSFWFNLLGIINWRWRVFRFPAEVFRKCGREIHVTIGDVISPEEQKLHNSDLKEFEKFLKSKTYELRKCK